MKALLLVASACLAACAAPSDGRLPAPKVGEVAPPCQLVYRVGSNISARECAATLTEEERQRNADEWKTALKPAGRLNTGSGG